VTTNFLVLLALWTFQVVVEKLLFRILQKQKKKKHKKHKKYQFAWTVNVSRSHQSAGEEHHHRDVAKLQLSRNRNPCPENQATFPSRIAFEWLTCFIVRGYRRGLNVTDLFALPLDQEPLFITPIFDKYFVKRHLQKRIP
jgi:hypothetical protein